MGSHGPRSRRQDLAAGGGHASRPSLMRRRATGTVDGMAWLRDAAPLRGLVSGCPPVAAAVRSDLRSMAARAARRCRKGHTLGSYDRRRAARLSASLRHRRGRGCRRDAHPRRRATGMRPCSACPSKPSPPCIRRQPGGLAGLVALGGLLAGRVLSRWSRIFAPPRCRRQRLPLPHGITPRRCGRAHPAGASAGAWALYAAAARRLGGRLRRRATAALYFNASWRSCRCSRNSRASPRWRRRRPGRLSRTQLVCSWPSWRSPASPGGADAGRPSARRPCPRVKAAAAAARPREAPA